MQARQRVQLTRTNRPCGLTSISRPLSPTVPGFEFLVPGEQPPPQGGLLPGTRSPEPDTVVPSLPEPLGPSCPKRPFIPSVIPVTIAGGSHRFPFRTPPLSLPAPMVLPGFPGGRVGRCRNDPVDEADDSSGFRVPGSWAHARPMVCSPTLYACVHCCSAPMACSWMLLSSTWNPKPRTRNRSHSVRVRCGCRSPGTRNPKR